MKAKKKFRNLLIYLIAKTGLVYLYQLHLKSKQPLVRILCFHDVADNLWFENVIKMISLNYHWITPKDFKEKKFASNKINILLTFDDGYQSWIDNCLPILNK